jgi:DNA helicase HerA-like ATPase
MHRSAKRIFQGRVGKFVPQSRSSPSAADWSDMYSTRTDSQFFRDAVENVGKADDARIGRSPTLVGAEQRETEQTGTRAPAFERRDFESTRFIGRLVALNGTQGIVSCPLKVGEDREWSIGHLITIVHRTSRLVGTVCEIATYDGRWSEEDANAARVIIELNGEINDDPNGAPFFHRGVRSFPSLGAPAHRIRADDLRAIYTFRGRQGVEIGRLSQNDDIPAEIDVSELMRRHFAVLGSTGVGKTTSVSLLLRKSLAMMPKLRIIIFDPHNEYAAHFPGLAQIIDSESLELPFWMFKFDELADVVFSGRQPHADERDALYEVIRVAKTKYQAELSSSVGTSAVRRQPVSEGNSAASDSPTPYRIVDVIAVIEEWLGMLDQRFPRSELRALRYRLEGLNRDPRYRFMFGRLVVEDDIGKVISKLFRIPTRGLPVTIVRLAGLPNEVTNAVVSVLARLSFEIAFCCSGTYQINVLCEEAHRYISSDNRQTFGPARLAIGRIAKEGRKYGASLGIVTQRPYELDPTVLSQCSTLFAMRLANELDKGIIRAAAGVSAGSTIAFLSSIADREAIAFGEAIATPMRMKFADMSGRPTDGRALVSSDERDANPIDLRTLSAQLRGEAV